MDNLDHLLWERIRREAFDILKSEPALTSLMLSAIINRHSLLDSLSYRLAHRLAAPDLPAEPLLDLFRQVSSLAPEISHAIPIDIEAIISCDPAADQLSDVLLHMKGFHALTVYRFAHWLWLNGRRPMARYIQSRCSEVFQTDIHPAASIGVGVFIDHATGVVVGETTVIGDGVTLMQNVTLGGNGKTSGDRHPKVGNNAFIGAGAKIIGNIKIGAYSKVGASAVVLQSVPDGMTVVGIPARIIGESGHVAANTQQNTGR